jgi:hypothetical protein
MRISFGVVVMVLVAVGCGGSSSGADANSDVDATIDGPASADAGRPDAGAPDAGLCPPQFVAATPDFHDQFVSDAEAPLYVGARVFVGTDGTGDLLVAAYDVPDAPTGVDFDPVFETAPAHLELWWSVNADLIPQMQFASIAGTLNLSQACPTGVAGTLTDGVFQQVTPGGNDLAGARVDGGCMVTVPSLTFVIGDACP